MVVELGLRRSGTLSFWTLLSPLGGTWLVSLDPKIAEIAETRADVDLVRLRFDAASSDAELFRQVEATFRLRYPIHSWQGIAELDFAASDLDQGKIIVLLLSDGSRQTSQAYSRCLRLLAAVANSFVAQRDRGFRTKIILLFGATS
jgi:hypothetical protein